MTPPAQRQLTASTGFLPSEFLNLLATAAREIDRHVNQDGLCGDCRSAWPCARAVLAEHNLSAL